MRWMKRRWEGAGVSKRFVYKGRDNEIFNWVVFFISKRYVNKIIQDTRLSKRIVTKQECQPKRNSGMYNLNIQRRWNKNIPRSADRSFE